MKIMLLFILIGTLATAGCQGNRPETAIPLAQPTSTEQVETREPVAIVEIDNDIVELSSISDPSPQQSTQLNDLLELRSGFEQQANSIPSWAEVKPEKMEFAVVNIYDAGGSVAGGFELVKNLETSEQMVLSVVDKIEADGTVTRKDVNLPLQARFSIDAEGRFVNGDWYYVDTEGNEQVLYKTNDIGQLGGVPIEGEIIWSDTVFGIESGRDVSLAKLAEVVLPPRDFTGLTIDTEIGQITESEGAIIYIENRKGEWLEMVAIPQEIIEKLPGDYILDTDMMYLKDGLAYGAKLMDGKKNVLYVLRGGEYMEALTKEYSDNYPAEWVITYEGYVEGYNGTIPVIVGLSEDARNAAQYPFKSVKLSKEFVDGVADALLRSGYIRWLTIPGNEGVIFEDYIKVVEIGDGKYTIMSLAEDGVERRSREVDPRLGVSLIVTSEQQMTIGGSSGSAFSISVDDKGRLLWASNGQFLYNQYLYNLKDYVDKLPHIVDYYLIAEDFGAIINVLARFKDRCLVEGALYVSCRDVYDNPPKFNPEPGYKLTDVGFAAYDRHEIGYPVVIEK